MDRKRVLLGDYVTEYSVRNKSDEDIPVYSVTNSQGFCTEYFDKEVASKDKTTYKIVPKGYFAYNPSRINVGSVDWQRCEDRVIVSPLYNVFSVSEKMDQQYLYYFLRSDIGRQMINAKASGSVRDNLKMDMLKEMTIPYKTIEEQKRCVITLDELQKIIALRGKEIEKLDELIKARFVEMFGDENNSLNWDVVDVEEVADVQVGVVIKPSQYYTEKATGIPAFRSLNIGEGYIKNTDWVYFTKEGNKKNSKSILKENDLLIVRSGAPGTACVVTKEYVGYNAIDVIIAHPDCSIINPFYLCAYTNMPHGKNQILEGTGGAAQQHFNVGKYNKLKLMLPPMEIQDEFIDFVAQVDKSKVAVQKALDESQLLFDSLMQEYFG
jgi:type I restriction enzyme S subunit